MSAVPRSSVSKRVPVARVSSFETLVQSPPTWWTFRGAPTTSLRTRFDTSANTFPTVHAGDTLGMRSPWPVIKLTPKPLKEKPEQNTQHVSLNKPTIQNVRLGRNGRVAVRAMRPATSSSAEPNTRVLSDHQRRPRRVRAARLDSDQDRAKVQPGTEGGWAIAALTMSCGRGKSALRLQPPARKIARSIT
jgi:hypothetical protein